MPMCSICQQPRSKHLRHWTEVKDHERFNKELDMMPDGIHAKIYKFWDFNKKNKNRSFILPAGRETGCSAVERASETDVEREEQERKLKDEWEALPDPKPDFFEWGCDKSKPQVLLMLRDTAMNGRRMSDRIKAADVLLKHGKVPPKQTLEIQGKEDNVNLDELLLRICELKHIPLEAIKPFLTIQ